MVNERKREDEKSCEGREDRRNKRLAWRTKVFISVFSFWGQGSPTTTERRKAKGNEGVGRGKSQKGKGQRSDNIRNGCVRCEV